MSQSNKYDLARAAFTAVDPLLRLFLELGVTSPEAESLLRSMFVHAAKEWLHSENEGKAPSDARIALVTGIHRNFIHRILKAPPRIADDRKGRGLNTTKLMEAWFSDPRFLDGKGNPKALPEKVGDPSFQSLVRTFMPGAAPGVVLRQLQRASVVHRLNDDRIRPRSRSAESLSVSLGSMLVIASRGKAVLESIHQSLRNPDSRVICEVLPAFNVDVGALPSVRATISRRISSMFKEIAEEVNVTSVKERGLSGRMSTIELTVFVAEGSAVRGARLSGKRTKKPGRSGQQ